MVKVKNIIYYFIPLLAIVAGLIYFVILPCYFEIQRINFDVNSELLTLERAKSPASDVKEGLVNFLKVKDNLTNFKISIKKGGELTFIQEMEKLADQSQVDLTLNIGQPQKEENDNFLPVQLTMIGDFKKISKFCNELDKSNYYLLVDSILLTASETIGGFSRADFYLPTENLGNLTVKIFAKIYYEN
jgi:hypothetical protein